DTYKDRLPEELQKEGETIGDKYLNLRSLHKKSKRLAAVNAEPEIIAPILNDLDAQEKEISAFYDKVAAFFEKEKEEKEKEKTKDKDKKEEEENPYAGKKTSGSYTKEQIDQMPDPAFAAECKLKRIEANRKYIERYAETKPDKVAERKKELKEWGVE
ncbi:MAG: hypothetical protein LUE98_04645, partial [Tannerellaceae bacterium]|nr:hypothetical protein [Tannerellaceae bacterium]